MHPAAALRDHRTHLAHKAEHAVDLETGAVVAVTPIVGVFEGCCLETLKYFSNDEVDFSIDSDVKGSYKAVLS